MTDKMREEFDRWVRREGLYVGNDRGLYESHLVGWLWQAWQASRAALVIELPKAIRQVTWDDESMDVMWPCEVIEAIEAAGVRVKQ